MKRSRTFGLLLAAFVLLAPGRSLTTFADDTPAAGRKLALLVGVKEYEHPELHKLDFTENDVDELGRVLNGQGFNVTLLTTARGRNNASLRPTAANIRQQLQQLLKTATKQDLIVVGLSGHGIQPLEYKDSFFCPVDAVPFVQRGKLTDPDSLISIQETLGTLRRSKVGVKFFLVDACRNDPSIKGIKGVDDVSIDALPPQTGILLSCSPGEFSFENKSLGTGHGVFFYHVIEGLRGAAKDSRGRITWDELALYVRSEVPPAVQKLFGKDGGEQSPNAIGNLRGVPTVLASIRIDNERPKPSTRDFGSPSSAPLPSAIPSQVTTSIPQPSPRRMPARNRVSNRQLARTQPGMASPGMSSPQDASSPSQDGYRSIYGAWALQKPTESAAKPFEGHTGTIYCVAYIDARTAVSGSDDKTVRVWDVETGKERFRLNVGLVAGVANTPDGERLLFCSIGPPANRSISSGPAFAGFLLWDMKRSLEIGHFKGGESWSSCAVFAPDGKQVLVNGHGRTLVRWDVESGKIVRRMMVEQSIHHFAATSDLQWVAAVGQWNKDVSLWNADKGRLVHSFRGHTEGVVGVAFSPGEKRLVSSSKDKTVRLWDVDSHAELHCLRGHESTVQSVAFTPDGKRVLSGSDDHTVRLWDVATGTEVSCFRGHTGQIYCVAISPDGRQALSSGGDHSIHRWDLPPL